MDFLQLFHDIANPLTTATAALEMVLKDAEPGLRYQPNSIRELSLSLECLSYVQAVLHQNQVSTPSLHPKPNKFSLRQEVTAVIRLHQSQVKKEKIRLQVKIPVRLYLSGNSIFFRQILSNLLINAVEAQGNFLEEKTHFILIQATQSQTAITLTIQDHGQGISDHLQPYLFQPFFSTKKSSGLGLTIIKNLLEKEFSGTIKIESRPGQGSLFTLLFPRNPATQQSML